MRERPAQRVVQNEMLMSFEQNHRWRHTGYVTRTF